MAELEGTADEISPEAEGRVRRSFARQNAMLAIGAVLEAIRTGETDILLAFDARLTQQHGFIHAGIIAAITDTACGYAALSLMPEHTAVLTTEFKVNLLAPARGDFLRAHGRVVRAGRKLMVCIGETYAHEGATRKQVALMTASMMVIEDSGLQD
ncbi:MAG: hypothetical protein QOD74_560 [Variibacter sp.]|jgi:uncharacterized protein (TIGR00369 family)|nr:hypothetical protein [Variibacter sp.]